METVSSRLDIKTISTFGRVLGKNNSMVVRELVEAGKREIAVELYKGKKVSLGLGAKLAGVTLSEFIDLLKEHNVFLNLEKEDVEKALRTARKVIWSQFKRKLEEFKWKYKKDLMDKAKLKQYIDGWKAHVTYANSYELRRNIINKICKNI